MSQQSTAIRPLSPTSHNPPIICLLRLNAASSTYSVCLLLIIQIYIASGFVALHQYLPSPLSRLSPFYAPARHPRVYSLNESCSVSEDLDLNQEILRLRMEVSRLKMEREENQYASLLVEQFKYSHHRASIFESNLYNGQGRYKTPQTVHVILLHANTPQQHVHTVDFPKNSNNYIVLAFEEKNDCKDFLHMLIMEDMFLNVCLEEAEFELLVGYCETMGMSLAVVPKDFGFKPVQLDSCNNVNEVNNARTQFQSDLLRSKTPTFYRMELDTWG